MHNSSRIFNHALRLVSWVSHSFRTGPQLYRTNWIRSILGPAIGGALAQPCDNYPAIFARGALFDRFPFLLPNLVCAAILALGVVTGFLFLEETHPDKKHRRDPGLELGKWLLGQFQGRAPPQSFSKLGEANLEESISLLEEEEEPPGYSTTEGTPCRQYSRPQSPVATTLDIQVREGLERKIGGVQKAFSKQVILNIVGYGILA